jgi:hypothetical protein
VAWDIASNGVFARTRRLSFGPVCENHRPFSPPAAKPVNRLFLISYPQARGVEVRKRSIWRGARSRDAGRQRSTANRFSDWSGNQSLWCGRTVPFCPGFPGDLLSSASAYSGTARVTSDMNEEFFSSARETKSSLRYVRGLASGWQLARFREVQLGRISVKGNFTWIGTAVAK